MNMAILVGVVLAVGLLGTVVLLVFTSKKGKSIDDYTLLPVLLVGAILLAITSCTRKDK